MEYCSFGASGRQVSRIGFGCWAIGGHGYGRTDDAESVVSVRRAMELGVTMFDTADVYGFGHSEEVLAKALGPDRHNVVIATKFGVAWDQRGSTYRDISPGRVVAALEGSLRRLELECIPLYQIHWPDGSTAVEDTMAELLRCREAGKVDLIGCSNFPLELIRSAVRTGPLASGQFLFNLIERATEPVLSACRNDLGMGTLAYQVLGRGLFSGALGPGQVFGEFDTRGDDLNFRGGHLSRRLRVVDRLREVGAAYGKTPAQTAIRWALDSPSVDCALIGAKTPAHVEENVGAAGWRLSASDHAALAASAERSGERD